MILDDLVLCTRERIEKEKKIISPETMKAKAISLSLEKKKENYPFLRALSKPGMSFICEIKKASPSKGIIAEKFPYLEIAREYEEAGVDAISVLTETDYFLGDIKYLREIRENRISTPLLRKDFTIDEYMIFQALVNGASAILLICAILTDDQLENYGRIARNLGLSAIVEAHDEKEIKRAVKSGAEIIGVNNRNLKDFSVDIGNSGKLRNLVPSNIKFVAESGIKGAEDIKKLEEAGVDAVLIGETMMRANNKKEKLQELKGLL